MLILPRRTLLKVGVGGAAALAFPRAAQAAPWLANAHATAGATNNPATAAINTTGSDLIVATLAWAFGTGPPVMTDNLTNTWTPLTAVSWVGSQFWAQLYYCKAPTVGASHTFTASGTGIFASIAVQAWSGSAASPFDQQSGQAATGLTGQPGPITPTQANELIVAGVAVHDPATLTIDSGFTISDQLSMVGGTYYGVGMAYLLQTTAATVNPTWTASTSTSMVPVMASFIQSAGGGGGTGARGGAMSLMGVGP